MDNKELEDRLNKIKEAVKEDSMHDLFVRYKFAVTVGMSPEDEEFKAKTVTIVEDEIRRRMEPPSCDSDSCPIF